MSFLNNIRPNIYIDEEEAIRLENEFFNTPEHQGCFRALNNTLWGQCYSNTTNQDGPRKGFHYSSTAPQQFNAFITDTFKTPIRESFKHLIIYGYAVFQVSAIGKRPTPTLLDRHLYSLEMYRDDKNQKKYNIYLKDDIPHIPRTDCFIFIADGYEPNFRTGTHNSITAITSKHYQRVERLKNAHYDAANRLLHPVGYLEESTANVAVDKDNHEYIKTSQNMSETLLRRENGVTGVGIVANPITIDPIPEQECKNAEYIESVKNTPIYSLPVNHRFGNPPLSVLSDQFLTKEIDMFRENLFSVWGVPPLMANTSTGARRAGTGAAEDTDVHLYSRTLLAFRNCLIRECVQLYEYVHPKRINNLKGQFHFDIGPYSSLRTILTLRNQDIISIEASKSLCASLFGIEDHHIATKPNIHVRPPEGGSVKDITKAIDNYNKEQEMKIQMLQKEMKQVSEVENPKEKAATKLVEAQEEKTKAETEQIGAQKHETEQRAKLLAEETKQLRNAPPEGGEIQTGGKRKKVVVPGTSSQSKGAKKAKRVNNIKHNR